MRSVPRQPQTNNFGSGRKELRHYTRQPRSPYTQQSRGVVLTAIVLFALAGLLSGFSVGAFVRPGQRSQNNIPSQTATVPTTHKTAIPTTTPGTEVPQFLGEPKIGNYQYTEIPDGSTPYSFTAQAVSKSGEAITSSSITCKIWLTQDGKVSSHITTDRLRSVNTLSEPFPKEVSGMNFTAATPQTQMCNNGQGQWNYTLSPTLHAGTYYIVALMDWGGVHYNWSWIAIKVKQT